MNVGGDGLCYECRARAEAERKEAETVAAEAARVRLHDDALRAVVLLSQQMTAAAAETTRLREELAIIKAASAETARATVALVRLEEERRMAEQEKTKGSMIKNMGARAVDAAKAEVPEAAWRGLARASVKKTIQPVLAVLVDRGVIEKETAAVWTQRLKNPVWLGVYGTALGSLVTAHPGAARVAWVAKLGAEMRQESMASIVEAVIDPILDVVRSIAMAAAGNYGVDLDTREKQE